MTIQEKIQKKAEGFGQFEPVFLEGAGFALNNQWISVGEDLPCNYEELIYGTEIEEGTETIKVITTDKRGNIWIDYMVYEDGKWRWNDFEPDFWMIVPKIPKSDAPATLKTSQFLGKLSKILI